MIIFLWIILLANLYITFNYGWNLGTINNQDLVGGDYYFGVSSFLDLVMGDRFNAMNQSTENIFNFYVRLKSLASDLLLNGTWPTFSQINNAWDVIRDIFSAVFNVVKMLGSIWVYAFSLMVFFVYFTFQLMNIVYLVFLLLSGAYAKPLPNTYGSMSLIFQYLPL